MSVENENIKNENEAASDSHQHSCCNGHHDGSCGCHHHEEAAGEKPQLDEIPDVPFPDPTLQSLTESLATQALISMGLVPNPMTGKPVVRLNQAKHLVDSVQLIFDKSANNRSEEETKFMESILHELHMIFLQAKNKANA